MKTAGRLLLGAALLFATGWAALAIHYGGPPSAVRDALALGYVLASGVLLRAGRRRPAARLGVLALFPLVLAWWLSLTPRNDRDWQPDVAVLLWVEVAGDTMTVHNVRDNEYRTERDYTVRYEDRAYSLARLRTVDLFLVCWGSPWIAHTVLSFGFDDGRCLAISIETRKERGEGLRAFAEKRKPVFHAT